MPAPEMGQVVVVQPAPGGRLSGGYLYNQRMAEHGAWSLCNVQADALERAVAALGAPTQGAALVADSIWLTPGAMQPFLQAQERGWKVGVLLHSFPSLIAQTEAARPPLGAPAALELELVTKLDFAVLVGPHFEQWLLPRGVPCVRCAPGIADVFRAPPRPRVGPCRLVSLATHSPRKGLLDAAHALGALARERSDFRWTVVGNDRVDPGYSAALRAALTGFDATLLGQQAPDVTASLLTASDVLLMPSYDENHPLVLLEAMAASVPAVAYAAGAAATLLAPPERGLVVPIGDVAALQSAIRSLLESEERRQALARACFTYGAALPSWSVAADGARQSLAGHIAGARR